MNTTIANIGQLVKVVSNKTKHNFEIGSVVKMIRIDNNLRSDGLRQDDFELVNGKYMQETRFLDWSLDPSEYEILHQDSHYYNTTNLKGEELQDAKSKAAYQDIQVFGCFKDDSELSASDIYKLLPNILLTSVRRSLNTLEKERKITKSGKKQGIYGRKEFTFKKL